MFVLGFAWAEFLAAPQHLVSEPSSPRELITSTSFSHLEILIWNLSHRSWRFNTKHNSHQAQSWAGLKGKATFQQESWGIGLEHKPRLMHLESTNGYLQKSTDFIERLATAPSAAVPPIPRRNLQCPWTKNPIRFGYIEVIEVSRSELVSFLGSKSSLDLHVQYAQSVSLRKQVVVKIPV